MDCVLHCAACMQMQAQHKLGSFPFLIPQPATRPWTRSDQTGYRLPPTPFSTYPQLPNPSRVTNVPAHPAVHRPRSAVSVFFPLWAGRGSGQRLTTSPSKRSFRLEKQNKLSGSNAHATTWVTINRSRATKVRRIPPDFRPLQPQLAHNSTRLPAPTPATRIYAAPPPRLPFRVQLTVHSLLISAQPV